MLVSGLGGFKSCAGRPVVQASALLSGEVIYEAQIYFFDPQNKRMEERNDVPLK